MNITRSPSRLSSGQLPLETFSGSSPPPPRLGMFPSLQTSAGGTRACVHFCHLSPAATFDLEDRDRVSFIFTSQSLAQNPDIYLRHLPNLYELMSP